MFKRITMRTKLIAGFSLVVLLSGFLGYASLDQLYKIAKPLNVDIPRSIDILGRASYLDGLAELTRYYDEILTQSARNYA